MPEQTPESQSSVPAAANVPHPLQHTWCLWYSKAGMVNGVWEPNNKLVNKFATVEDFWRTINAVKSPSNLSAKQDYYLFKEGIEPAWEDPQNANGGSWTISYSKDLRVNDAFMFTILAMIGEQFSDPSEIIGTVLCPRGKEIRLSIWTKTASDETRTVRIGKEWQQVLGTPSRITYSSHAQSANRGDSLYHL